MSDFGMTSPEVSNRPGLPAIGYRAGTHGSFLRRMLARLPAQPLADGARPLAQLSTRAADDGAIALLDAWATVADVLTFYQERIANEGFLRTATERRSVLELARAIGYELRPGVAAATYLAFTVDDAPGSPTTSFVPKGTKVQSMPAHGGLPQTFEPTEDFTARVSWNVLRPRLTAPQLVDRAVSTLYLDGQPPDVKPGSVVAIVQTDPNASYFRGRARRVVSVAYDRARHSTKVVLDGPATPPRPSSYKLEPGRLGSPTSTGRPLDQSSADEVLAADWREQDLDAFLKMQEWDGEALADYASRGRSGGSVLPAEPLADPVLVGVAGARVVGSALTGTVVSATVPPDASKGMVAPIVGQFVLATQPDDGGTGFTSPMTGTLAIVRGVAGAGATGRIVACVTQPPSASRRLEVLLVDVEVSANGTLGSRVAVARLSPPEAPPPPVAPGVLGFKSVSLPFGHNALEYSDLPAGQRGDFDWDADPETQSVVFGSGRRAWPDASFFLERAVPEATRGSCVALQEADSAEVYQIAYAHDRHLREFALSGRATGVSVRADVGEARFADGLLDFHRKTATIHVGSHPLELAGTALEEPFGKGGEEVRQLTLDTMVLGLRSGQPIVVSGERADLPGTSASEIAVLVDAIHHDRHTTLFFERDLKHSYVRESATLTANVVPATHGETVRQVLGSGDAGRTNQRFTLNKKPLTHVAASNATGAATALEVRVGGVLWEEAPALFGLDGHAQRYAVRTGPDGQATVEFGDGQEGARLPTGSENVTAVYRSGLGLAGHVPAGSLTLLQTRPSGIRSVVNHLPATGAAEPEDLEGARANAPRTVLTLDRIVSAQDFEDFARGFASIGKARAVALQGADARFVHLTVAGADGGVVDPQSSLYLSLVDAIRRAADPGQPFMVDRHLPRFFDVSAKVLVDPRYEVAPVLAAVGDAIRQAFSFGPRSFGQPVTAAAVVTVIQGVAGVVAADLDRLYRVDEPGGPLRDSPVPVLKASAACIVDTEIRASELLLVNESGVTLSEMSR